LRGLKKIVFRNISILIIDKGIRAFYTLFIGAFIARYFGPEKFGFISITVTTATILASFSNFGADGIVVKELVTRPKLESKIFGTIYFSRFFICIALYVLLILYYLFINKYKGEEFIILLLISSTLLFNFSDSLDLWFQYKMINHKTILSKMFILIIITIIRFIMLKNNVSLLFFSISYFIESILTMLAMHFIFFINYTKIKFKLVYKILKSVLYQSWPNLISGIMVVVYTRIDQIMINLLLTKKDLGLFSASVPFSTAIYFLPMAIATIFSPIISKYKKENILKYESIFKSLYAYSWLLLIPFCLTIYLMAPYIINTFFGIEYQNSVSVLRVLIFSCIPVSLGIFQGIWIVNEKRNKLNLYKSIIGAISNTILNFIFIPIFGILGAAIATLFSQFMASMFINYFLCKEVFYSQLPSFKFKYFYDFKNIMNDK
jgi:O-antigen/teichoic acid export membrane protein